MRRLRDPIAPRYLDTVFVALFERLEQPHMLTHFRVLEDQLLVALDGTTYFSSKAMHCQNSLTRQLTHGQTLYSHAAIPPGIVCPGPSLVMALPPASIMPHDGQATQDCERAAGKRWLTNHAEQGAPHGITWLGDDLYSNQPCCALVFQNHCNCICTSTPDAHPTRYERLALWQATGAIAEHEERHFHGRCTAVTRLRSLNEVLLRSGADALAVPWVEITVVHVNTGEQLYHQSWITNHRLRADNV